MTTDHASGPAGPDAPKRANNTVKETLTSITIAFAMAFVFRGFVVEGFVIPTGSMAPTLMGQHMRLSGDESGYDWPVGPWYYDGAGVPLPVQGGVRNPGTGGVTAPIEVFDPMTLGTVRDSTVPRTAGDRVFVLKYLDGVYEPERWDVVVFKNPQSPQENFIKRLLGLPDEQIALVDGDVFVRSTTDDSGAPRVGGGTDTWAEGSWAVARKPERVQRELWYPLFDSVYTPPEDAISLFRAPWVSPQGSSWDTTTPTYTYDGSGPTTLAWDTANWAITDLVAYNVHPRGQLEPAMSRPRYNAGPRLFPVSDLRSGFEIVPADDADGVTISAVLRARGHEFRVRIEPVGAPEHRATFEMRPLPDTGEDVDVEPAPWTALGTSDPFELRAGEATEIDAWFVDQTLQLWIDAERVGVAEYAWSPAERIRHATGRTIEDLVQEERGPVDNQFALNRNFRTPEFAWSFDAGPFELRRVRLDRDLHYQATPAPRVRAWGTHPDHYPTLGPDEYFVCGDNSASSDDGRLWTRVDPWVRDLEGNGLRPGVVPGSLMVGKAWVVYLPAPLRDGIRFSLDFGRMRWIW